MGNCGGLWGTFLCAVIATFQPQARDGQRRVQSLLSPVCVQETNNTQSQGTSICLVIREGLLSGEEDDIANDECPEDVH